MSGTPWVWHQQAGQYCYYSPAEQCLVFENERRSRPYSWTDYCRWYASQVTPAPSDSTPRFNPNSAPSRPQDPESQRTHPSSYDPPQQYLPTVTQPIVSQSCETYQPYAADARVDARADAHAVAGPSGQNLGAQLPSRVSQQLGPQQLVPQQLVPQQLVPRQLVPQQLVPQQVVPQQVLPQQLVPQQLALQQLAPQQLAPQQLAPDYLQQPASFFRRYRIFKKVWHESAGDDSATVASQFTRDNRFGQNIFTKIRWFALFRVEETHCLCFPITTYKRQGTAKRGVNPAHHAIVYTEGQPYPTRREQEQGIMRTPIRVVKDKPDTQMDPLSRIDYSRIYTVELNNKVKPFGWIHEGSRRDFDVDAAGVYHSLGTQVRRNVVA